MYRKIVVSIVTTVLLVVALTMLVLDYGAWDYDGAWDYGVDSVRQKYYGSADGELNKDTLRISDYKGGITILPKRFPGVSTYKRQVRSRTKVVQYGGTPGTGPSYRGTGPDHGPSHGMEGPHQGPPHHGTEPHEPMSPVSDPLHYTDLDSDQFHRHQFSTFTDSQHQFDVDISTMKPMDDDITAIVQQFMASNSDFYHEILPYFQDDIGAQLSDHTVAKHWYKLAGTSVWLEQYGVHFMISRVVYSPKAIRNAPTFSMTYAQVFDENWNELKQVSLVVPTNCPHHQLIVGDTPYTTVTYPQFLPVPTLHEPHRTKNRYYGPEDPRLMLVKNKGYEEPLIVFNAYHGKIANREAVDDTSETLKYKYYRSMFMSWPWQFQRGKQNVEELPNQESNPITYLKAVELRRSGTERQKTQKNWTPFVDFSERKSFGYDKYIYFVYRWSDLEVLRCEMGSGGSGGLDGGPSNCEFAYKMRPELDGGAPVGPLRGGTELININSLVEDAGMTGKFPLPKNTEVWIGFARAHLKNCGCGKDMYRPNLVVVVKDSQKRYKIDLISSFVSLDVPVVGWDLDKPHELCNSGHPSVFIPNGISSWTIRDFDDTTKEFEDYLTLTFSLADATIDSIQMKGVLKQVLKVMKPSRRGYDNDNVNAALQESIGFCGRFGKENPVSKPKENDQKGSKTA